MSVQKDADCDIERRLKAPRPVPAPTPARRKQPKARPLKGLKEDSSQHTHFIHSLGMKIHTGACSLRGTKQSGIVVRRKVFRKVFYEVTQTNPIISKLGGNQMSFLIGVDLGGTNIVAGLLDNEGRLLQKIKQPTEAAQGSDHVIQKIGQTVETLLEQGGASRDQVIAMGMGIPGFLDPEQGISKSAVNLGWRNKNVAKPLTKKLQVPVFIDNDVRMFTLGEALKGAGKAYDHVLGITLGTGVAAAVINKGHPYHGGDFMAGELGHIRIDEGDLPCNCGLRGCLETVASANGIARLARGAIAQGEKSVLQEWFGEDRLSELTASDVSKAYDEGDDVAKRVFARAGNRLGKALSYAVTLFSPDVIVIGGGGAQAGERLFQPMREEMKRSLIPAYWERLSIKTAELLDDAGIIGSALNAKQRVGE